jgi:glycosyltransferase involved in cell wall biosynthesis
MDNGEQKHISIIVPAYNEADAVSDLHQEILEVCRGLNQSFEIIFINDGSTDPTLEKLKRLKPIKIIDFRKNFGQTAALDAGIKVAQGKYIVTLDGDGQNDPHDIPKLLTVLNDGGYDVVSGWRKNRKDKTGKILFSFVAAKLRLLLINDGIHDSGCTLKVYKKECFDRVDLVGEAHRFIPAILKIKGYKIGEVIVNHRFRTTGVTKYDWRRSIKGLLDIVSIWFWKKYANRPLHLFGGFGIVLALISFISGIVVVWRKVFMGFDLSDTILSELTIYMFLVAIQFMIFGLLADIVSKVYFSATKDVVYDIREIINCKEDNEQK